MLARAALPGVLFLTACSSTPAAPPAPPDSPAFDAAWRISTHNSYWVDRGVMGDLFASGTQERLADQLLVDHARGIEIDVHRDPATPGAFAVYHTTPGNGLCDTLPGCLAALRAFHHALPDHEALQVTLEFKEITASLFDPTHTIEDLDRVLADELGSLLYRPADFMARCPGETTLSACARKVGWPTTHELRGRVVVTPLGNWDGIGAQATKDFVDYALHGDIRDRAGFPMSSSWQLDHEALNGTIYNLVTQADLDGAFAQSVFLQVEDLADPHLLPFVAGHGVVRLDGAVSADDQRARAALGAQLLQGDSPWVQYDDHGPSHPLRDLSGKFGLDVMKEPGSRLALGPGEAGERVFAYAVEMDGDTAWETTVSSGADATRVGCLRAATTLGADEGSITVCRAKIPADRDAGAGAPDAERAVVRVTACQGGACATTEHPSKDPAAGGPGELLRLEVSAGAGGTTCVRVRSASGADKDLVPTWEDLGAPTCFPGSLRYQGLATPSMSWFFGTRHERADAGVEVTGSVFAGVVAEAVGDADAGPSDGGYRDAGSLLVDDSSR